MMELLYEIIQQLLGITIFAKKLTSDIWHGLDYPSVNLPTIFWKESEER